MFMAFAFVLLVASVPLTGGRLSRLADLRVRWAGVAVAALGLQVAMTSLVLPRPALVGLHAASYVLLGAALWVNRRLTGLVVLGTGAMVNAVVIGLNGGTLPARPEALRAAGWSPDAAFSNSGVLAHPVLPWLGDVAATPSWLPFRNVISVGDVLILVGAAVLLHVTCRSPGDRPGARLRGCTRDRAADEAPTSVRPASSRSASPSPS